MVDQMGSRLQSLLEQGESSDVAQPRKFTTGGALAVLYLFSAAGLLLRAAFCAMPGVAERSVLGSTALALLTDFGPNAIRSVPSSNQATAMAVDRLVEASPAMILVDNFVHNLGAEPDEAGMQVKLEASSRVAACQRWALFVRGRLAGDAAGVCLMLRGFTCFGAALVLAAHSACWALGGAAARVNEQGQPAALSPPLAKVIGGLAAGLAAVAAAGGLAPTPGLRMACSTAFASAMVAVQLARVTADGMRGRIHVGL